MLKKFLGTILLFLVNIYDTHAFTGTGGAVYNYVPVGQPCDCNSYNCYQQWFPLDWFDWGGVVSAHTASLCNSLCISAHAQCGGYAKVGIADDNVDAGVDICMCMGGGMVNLDRAMVSYGFFFPTGGGGGGGGTGSGGTGGTNGASCTFSSIVSGNVLVVGTGVYVSGNCVASAYMIGCANGYYGMNSGAASAAAMGNIMPYYISNCVQCPPMSGQNITYYASGGQGEAAATCYMASNIAYTDAAGIFIFTSNCYYS